MINKMEALATHIGCQAVGTIEPDRMRFWELYNKYKSDMSEILELMTLMQLMMPKEFNENED